MESYNTYFEKPKTFWHWRWVSCFYAGNSWKEKLYDWRSYESPDSGVFSLRGFLALILAGTPTFLLGYNHLLYEITK